MGVFPHHGLLVVVLFACKPQPARDSQFDDPAQASARVRAIATSCDGITRALDQLARARVSGRLLGGLVDETLATAQCGDPAGAVKGSSAAHQLARARIDDGRPDAALAYLAASGEPAVRYRRAELLDRVGRSGAALQELDGITLDDEGRALQRLLAVSLAARESDYGGVDRFIASVPLSERPRLAHRAVADAPVEALSGFALTTSLEVAVAAADRLEPLEGPAALLTARRRIVALDPSVAEHWDALGRAHIASGNLTDALAAWERAVELAPAQHAYRLAPIRALVIAGDAKRAQFQAEKLANTARDASDVELLVTASSGAAIAGDRKLAVELARAARARRSADGRLAFLVAQRLAEAGETNDAAGAYTDLLVCGAHGRAWHRHEVAGKLSALAATSDAARTIVHAVLGAKRVCETVDPDDLKQYLDGLAAR
jgi:cytochrome c-type biogenesis protein CcmH/NrfG